MKLPRLPTLNELLEGPFQGYQVEQIIDTMDRDGIRMFVDKYLTRTVNGQQLTAPVAHLDANERLDIGDLLMICDRLKIPVMDLGVDDDPFRKD